MESPKLEAVAREMQRPASDSLLIRLFCDIVNIIQTESTPWRRLELIDRGWLRLIIDLSYKIRFLTTAEITLLIGALKVISDLAKTEDSSYLEDFKGDEHFEDFILPWLDILEQYDSKCDELIEKYKRQQKGV